MNTETPPSSGDKIVDEDVKTEEQIVFTKGSLEEEEDDQISDISGSSMSRNDEEDNNSILPAPIDDSKLPELTVTDIYKKGSGAQLIYPSKTLSASSRTSSTRIRRNRESRRHSEFVRTIPVRRNQTADSVSEYSRTSSSLHEYHQAMMHFESNQFSSLTPQERFHRIYNEQKSERNYTKFLYLKPRMNVQSSICPEYAEQNLPLTQNGVRMSDNYPAMNMNIPLQRLDENYSSSPLYLSCHHPSNNDEYHSHQVSQGNSIQLEDELLQQQNMNNVEINQCKSIEYIYPEMGSMEMLQKNMDNIPTNNAEEKQVEAIGHEVSCEYPYGININVETIICKDDNQNGEIQPATEITLKTDDHIPISIDDISHDFIDEDGLDKHQASPDSKYRLYACEVDQTQDDKAVQILLFTFDRPHMRCFHMAWISFFFGFFSWFALTPLLKEIMYSLDLSEAQIWNSSILSASGTVVCRLLSGILCDRYGARIVMTFTLIFASLPVMVVGIAHEATELYVLRLLSGVGGSAFVTSQSWTSSMFTREVAGTANSIVAGWGNLGGALAHILMGSAFFPLFRTIYNSADKAWRTCCIIPFIPSAVVAFFLMRCSDDTPKGNIRKRKRQGLIQQVSVTQYRREAIKNRNLWILSIQYSCCFGVEVAMTNAATLYFIDRFGLNTETAAAISSIFGWMNLFARGLGGFVSDILNMKMGMKGRLIWQSISILFEGSLVIAFSFTHSLATAIVTMTCFSLFVQSSEGSTFSIVPYVLPRMNGFVSGIVGAGGSLGGVIFLVMFRYMNYQRAFIGMGLCAVVSSFLSVFLCFDREDEIIVDQSGHGGMISDSKVDERHPTEDNVLSSFPIRISDGESNTV